jgi:hypothetical protein
MPVEQAVILVVLPMVGVELAEVLACVGFMM